jgi:WD40 repeat protein
VQNLNPYTGIVRHKIINTGNLIRKYICVDFSKNAEDYLFVGTTTGDFLIFSLKNSHLSGKISVSALGVTSIRSVTKNILVVGCGNGDLQTFNVDGHKITPRKQTQICGGITSLSVSQDEKEILAATKKGFVYRIKEENLKYRLQSENHTEAVYFVAYPPKVSDKFATCAIDGTIRLWDVSNYQVLARCTSKSTAIPICFQYNEEVVISGWDDEKIRMFGSEDG